MFVLSTYFRATIDHLAMSALHPLADIGLLSRDVGEVPDSTKRMQTPGYRPFASGFTNSRTDSMKICATGLSDRFFKVVRPTGCRGLDSFTGNALSPGCLR